MSVTELASQWPALALLLGFSLFLLKLVQSQYLDQIREIRADRDAWRLVAEKNNQQADRVLTQSERLLAQIERGIGQADRSHPAIAEKAP